VLLAVGHHIPCGRGQWVDVHCCARAFRSKAEPPKGRPRILIHEGEPIMREQIWHLKVINNWPDQAIVIHIGLEEVQWAVVLLIADVISIVFELHPEFLAFVVFGHLESHIAKSLL